MEEKWHSKKQEVSEGYFTKEDQENMQALRQQMASIFRSSDKNRIVRMGSLYTDGIESGIFERVTKIFFEFVPEEGGWLIKKSSSIVEALNKEWNQFGERVFLKKRSIPDSLQVEECAKQSVLRNREDILPILRDFLEIEYMRETVDAESISKDGSIFAHYVERASRRVEEWEKAQREIPYSIT